MCELCYTAYTETFTDLAPCGVVAGTNAAITTDNPDDIATLGQSDPDGPKYPDRVDDIKRVLSTYVSDDRISTYTYRRQVNDEIRDGNGAWGKAAVSPIYPASSILG